MAVELTALIPAFRTPVQTLLDNCRGRGVEMRPYFTIRTPLEQAKLWRQSRSRQEIEQKLDELRRAGAEFLAHCIESIGPQHGDPVTNALPGYSWHQWNEAVDCFWVVNGKSEWSTQKLVNGINGYKVYAEEAVKLNLNAGGLWKKLKDWPHVQQRPDASPATTMSLREINEGMRERFAT
jgi:peptidoglycan L-alanyl-D-glutamate endopeptidase CwlK